MAVMTQATNPAPGIGRAFGEGLVTGYEDASDEKALQEAIHRLPKDASPRDILDAIVGTRASKEAKQDMLKNYMGVAEFEEKKRQFNETARINESKIKKDITKANTVNNYRTGLETVNMMKNIRKKGNLGRGSGITKFFGTETQKDYGEYEQLGKSLISLASNIPIRNRQEFEVLAHSLYDPTIPDSQAEGILNAMESLISRNLQEYEQDSAVPAPTSNEDKKKAGKVHVMDKKTKTSGWVTPYEGMEAKYDKLDK